MSRSWEGRMEEPLKARPPYAITSVDHALRLAAILQAEGAMTVTEAASRLGVARSTAHRLLSTLVYRDFAVQDDDKSYRVGPALEMAARSRSSASLLRQLAVRHLQRLVDILGESANIAVRTGDTTRCIASVESPRSFRVGSREGLVFPAHRTTAGLLLLAELADDELTALYTREGRAGGPDLSRLKAELETVRREGYALNRDRSEQGVTAVGVAVHAADGMAVGGLSVSMPSVRFERGSLPTIVATLLAGAGSLERDIAR